FGTGTRSVPGPGRSPPSCPYSRAVRAERGAGRTVAPQSGGAGGICQDGAEDCAMKTLLRWITGAVVVGLAVGSASVTLGQRGMTRMVRRDVTALLTRAEPVPAGVVTDTMLSDLPEPVRRYLAYSGIVGKPMAGTVHLKQTGRMRLSP